MLTDNKIKYWKIDLWKFEGKYSESNVSKWSAFVYHAIATETQISYWKRETENENVRIEIEEIKFKTLNEIK